MSFDANSLTSTPQTTQTHGNKQRLALGVLLLLKLRGTILNRTYGTYETPPHFAFFTNNTWSYLLWSLVSVRLPSGEVHRFIAITHSWATENKSERPPLTRLHPLHEQVGDPQRIEKVSGALHLVAMVFPSINRQAEAEAGVDSGSRGDSATLMTATLSARRAARAKKSRRTKLQGSLSVAAAGGSAASAAIAAIAVEATAAAAVAAAADVEGPAIAVDASAAAAAAPVDDDVARAAPTPVGFPADFPADVTLAFSAEASAENSSEAPSPAPAVVSAAAASAASWSLLNLMQESMPSSVRWRILLIVVGGHHPVSESGLS